jgi:hypothetical protein
VPISTFSAATIAQAEGCMFARQRNQAEGEYQHAQQEEEEASSSDSEGEEQPGGSAAEAEPLV